MHPSKKSTTKKMTVEVPIQLHKQIKVKAAQEGIKIKEYIIGLVEKDLGKEKL